MIWSMLVGLFIGAVAGSITNRGERMGCFTKVFAGWFGSSVGQALLGHWGPSFAGMALIPSIIGAVIVIAVVDFFFGGRR